MATSGIFTCFYIFITLLLQDKRTLDKAVGDVWSLMIPKEQQNFNEKSCFAVR